MTEFWKTPEQRLSEHLEFYRGHLVQELGMPTHIFEAHAAKGRILALEIDTATTDAFPENIREEAKLLENESLRIPIAPRTVRFTPDHLQLDFASASMMGVSDITINLKEGYIGQGRSYLYEDRYAFAHNKESLENVRKLTNHLEILESATGLLLFYHTDVDNSRKKWSLYNI